MSSTKSCGCGCSPCVCNTPETFGCLTDLCLPRPCFFSGQLISADDLNALVAYFRAKEALLARFVGGWGILGGLRVSPGAGVERRALTQQAISDNPQIFAGTAIQVHPGVGVDARGRTLALCSTMSVDLLDLAPPAAHQTHMCQKWLSPLPAPLSADIEERSLLTATPYWLVAQFVERPSRQVPQYTGGGPCDPAPTCNHSRRIEEIELRLVHKVPSSYFLTGCLDEGRSPELESLERLLVDAAGSGGGGKHGGGLLDPCVLERYAIIDAIGAAIAEGCCCSNPGLVLGRVLLTQHPKELRGALPGASMYTILLDGYPYRRMITLAALETFLSASASCRATTEHMTPPRPLTPNGATGEEPSALPTPK